MSLRDALIAYHPYFYAHPLPSYHRFPMEKYDLLPLQLQREGLIQSKQFYIPTIAGELPITLVHSKGYYQALQQGKVTKTLMRRIGFPYSHRLFLRECAIVEGTIKAALHALRYGLGFNISGGTHHAARHWGEGYCLFNDVAIAAAYLLHQKKAKKVLIIDLDVHQGNGTALIFQNNPKVFTFSMHGANNFPLQKAQSDWDIALPDQCDDATYLNILQDALNVLYKRVQPDMLFYVAGVDVLKEDQFGRLALSIEGLKQREWLIAEFTYSHSLPMVVCPAGGYPKSLTLLVQSHTFIYKAVHYYYG